MTQLLTIREMTSWKKQKGKKKKQLKGMRLEQKQTERSSSIYSSELTVSSFKIPCSRVSSTISYLKESWHRGEYLLQSINFMCKENVVKKKRSHLNRNSEAADNSAETRIQNS